MLVPKSMKALVTVGDGSFELLEVPVPIPKPNEILIKVIAVAGNHTDWKTITVFKQRGNIVGADFAGIVVALGSEVPPHLRKIGERVAGCVRGSVNSNGAFAEYLRATANLVFSLPDNITFEDAAQLGVATYGACQCLYQTLRLPTPFESLPTPTDILIWSGTSSTGQYAIQLAKQAGLRIISTCSPKNFDKVKALGADLVFDYADSFTPRKIYEATGGNLKLAVDCISEGRTPAQVSACLSDEGGTIATVLPYQSRKRGVTATLILVYTIWGEEVEHPFRFPPTPEHYTNGVAYTQLITEMLAKGMFKLGTIKLYPHGLASVAEGFEYMKSGKIHAEKLVFRIADTPGL